MAEDTPQKHPASHLEELKWKPGQSGNPKGRPRGARTKLAEDFVGDALKAWREDGPAALKTMATEDPSKFCQMIAGLLPKELNVTTQPAEELSQDELDALVVSVKQLVAAATAQPALHLIERTGSPSQH